MSRSRDSIPSGVRNVAWARAFNWVGWGWSRRIIDAIEGNGIACHMIEWFISRERYLASLSLSRYQGLFFSVYDLSDAAELHAARNRILPQA